MNTTEMKKTKEDKSMLLPVLALRGLVVFPGMMLQFDVGRKKSILALSKAMEDDQLIFLVTQRDLSDNEPRQEQLYQTGVVARIKQLVRHPEDGVRLFVEGLYRAEMTDEMHDDPFLLAKVTPCKLIAYRKTQRGEALIRYTQNLFEEYLQNYSRIPPDIIVGVVQKKDCGELADYIASNIMFDFEKKQMILEEPSPVKRLNKLVDILKNEIQVLEIENQISEKAKEQIDQNQREYYLREQMKAIAYELGEDDNPQEEADTFRERIAKLCLPELQEKKLLKECDRLAKLPFGSHESSVILGYLETCLDLPWNTLSEESINLDKARKILDREHYGLKKVKERILEVLAVRKLAPEIKGQIICLVGPPGVGKTSIARSIAEALGRKYVRVSLGGVRDESDIVGHRKTYVGSMPGRIIAAMKQAGTRNPLLLLDEIDKLSHDFRGDPASALLEVLDAEQNMAFHDHYIDMPFDLSDVLFITTANDFSAIPEPLADRMDVITLGSYTHEEKFHIATKHLIPKQYKKHGITPKMVRIQPAAVHALIDGYTREAGVRNLERQIASLCRKCAAKLVEDPETRITITQKSLEPLLGPARFKNDDLHKTDEIGLVNGLAWTSVGGEILPIEVAVMEGTGKIELTGSLGDVMKESARTAISCIRTRASSLGIEHDFHTKYDIHIHAPEGAIPKDGPSAGTAMATAITSALCRVPVRHDVAMTGEITLLGRVLPIGGLKEKTMAAYRAGVKTVIIPSDNVPDLAEIDSVVKDSVTFLPVQKVDQVLEAALVRTPETKAGVVHNSTGVLPVPAGQPATTAPSIPQ
ncbi:endopeptidase La [Anaeromassilibacillus senegalensis]|uniref:endopeptidase La n=1 Tax=Anaeromassilibacillus senegalensis TaxID=1673717 RepID=UPI000AE838B2|nr:endopeptidase La [Anaeromassilibacillus senegalensis]